MHQIRYSTKFISYKDLKPFMADLKLVYKADTEDLALTALEDLEEKWGKKYPASIGSWRNNWTQLSTYFKYPSEIRKLIYTTNSIENFNRQLRKVTKSKTIFPTDDALFKMLYLAMMDATKKWTGKAWLPSVVWYSMMRPVSSYLMEPATAFFGAVLKSTPRP